MNDRLALITLAGAIVVVSALAAGWVVDSKLAAVGSIRPVQQTAHTGSLRPHLPGQSDDDTWCEIYAYEDLQLDLRECHIYGGDDYTRCVSTAYRNYWLRIEGCLYI